MATRIRSARPKLTGPKRVIWLVILTAMAVGILAGGPLTIVNGIGDVQHANQIKAHGVTVTATVLSDDQNYRNSGSDPCWGAEVSYVTADGASEHSDLDNRGACLAVGSQVRVVYDTLAPNVVQPVSQRGNASGGWSTLVAGIIITVAAWAIALWGFASQWRARRRRTGRQRQAAAATQAPM